LDQILDNKPETRAVLVRAPVYSASKSSCYIQLQGFIQWRLEGLPHLILNETLVTIICHLGVTGLTAAKKNTASSGLWPKPTYVEPTCRHKALPRMTDALEWEVLFVNMLTGCLLSEVLYWPGLIDTPVLLNRKIGVLRMSHYVIRLPHDLVRL